MCQERDIAIILGAPYNQGRMLGLGQQTPEALAHLRRYLDISDRYAVPIRAAALQFVVAHPAVVSVIPGPASMEEMTDNIRMTEHSIPPEFWADMLEEGLIAAGCPLPSD